MPSASRITAVSLGPAGLELTMDVGVTTLAWSQRAVLRVRLMPPEGPAPVVAEMEPTFVADLEVTESWTRALEAWSGGSGPATEPSPDPSATLDLPLGQYHRLRIAQDPLEFTLLDADRALWQSLAGRTMRVDSNGRRWLYHRRDDGDLIYGLGEKSGRLVRNARSLQLKSVDAAGYDPATGDPLYKHIPFYLVHQPDRGQDRRGLPEQRLARPVRLRSRALRILAGVHQHLRRRR